jgi:hypothetical protein
MHGVNVYATAISEHKQSKFSQGTSGFVNLIAAGRGTAVMRASPFRHSGLACCREVAAFAAS